MKPIDSVRAKVDRAKKHIGDLRKEVGDFLTSNPYSIATKRDQESRRLVYYVSGVRETPLSIALTAGDALKNLREALDHLAYQLVLNSGQKPGKQTYFPISDDPQKYKTEAPGKTKGMSREVVTAIDSLRPYRGGNDRLWRLHQLGIVDKHRAIVTVGSAFRAMNIAPVLSRGMPTMPDGQPVSIPDLWLRPADRCFPLKEGTDLFTDAPDAEIDARVQFSFEVAIGEPGIVEGEPLVEVLDKILQDVETVITSLAPFL